MLLTLKNLTHHADIPAGDLRIIPSKGGKSWLIVSANGQAIAEMVPTQDTKKSMARAALLAHGLNCLPITVKSIENLKAAGGMYLLEGAGLFTNIEDLSKIGV